MLRIFLLAIAAWLIESHVLIAQIGIWNNVSSTNTATGRHENGFVSAGDKLYLIGGRGIKPVQSFNIGDSTWTNNNVTPQEIHHFQAVNFNNLIVIAGAFTGGYPYETPIPHMWIYDPLKDMWHIGPSIPIARRRGAAGAVLYNGKIYLLGGLTNGHLSGWVKWLDVFDPAGGEWKILSDAPQERDHFHAVVAQDRIYAAGGRMSGSAPSVFEGTIGQVNYFNLNTHQWSILDSSNNIPTERAGCFVANVGDNVVVVGGESGSQVTAHNECEILNTSSHTWSTAGSLNAGRHGTQMTSIGDYHYVCAGSGNRGGGPELSSIEVLVPSTGSLQVQGAISEGQLQMSSCMTYQNVGIGDSITQQFSIKHIAGNQAVMIKQIELAQSNDYQISGNLSMPLLLAPGKEIVIDVKLVRQQAGLVQNQLLINTVIPDDTVFAVKLEAPDTEIPIINSSVGEKLCQGETTVLSTVGTYQAYRWGNQSNSSTIVIGSAGLYSVMVSDADGCKYQNSISLVFNSPIGIVGMKNSVQCFGANNGSIVTSAFGGSAPYSYLWNDALNSQTAGISNLTAGTYSVVVTDSVGCSHERSFTIKSQTPLFVMALPNVPTAGNVNLLVSGGVNPYSFVWSNGATTEDLSNINPGTYIVMIRDTYGCTKVLMVTVP